MEKQSKKHTRYNNIILIPTDFSEVCEFAVNHGIELARILNYRVCILHVIGNMAQGAKNEGDHQPDQTDRNLLKLREIIEKDPKVKIEVLTREGNFLKVINKVAGEIKANLMILGTHGKQGLQHLFGSHALKVVLDSPCPVVVVQSSFNKGYQDIVLPVSSDLEPRQSIDWILLMSRLFSSKIHIFQSHETDPDLNTRQGNITTGILKILDEKKVPYDTRKADPSKDFSSQVISFSVETMSDLIMIMTMPGEHMPGFNFAAWNEKLMFNEARIPVMCVNPIELGEFYSEWITLS